MKSNENFTLKYTYRSLLLVFLIFFIISFIVLMGFKIDSQSIQNTIGILNKEKIFVRFFGAENHYYFLKNEEPLLTVSKMSTIGFQLATAIKPTDARTFLGNELPGLRIYDTEIVVAGEGTNLATLPLESSPPLDVLLHERKVAEEKLNQNNTPQDNKPITNPAKKSVFIYQSHSYESFLPLLQDAKVPNDAISNDERVNVINVGQRLADDLMKKGIGVDHDKTNMTQELHKRGWQTPKAYTVSHQIVEAAAGNNNNLKYYIDIHRDDARANLTTKTINGEKYARLYFIVGKENKNYLENLALVKKLNSELETKYPGISRGIFLKTYSEGNGIYNQDISNKAMLMEVGGVDNNLDELYRTVDAFSEILANYYWSSNDAKEVNGNG
ncbi:stage II sporulation protein P [Bacillus sp. UNC438CL73TsuS30]|uniref:stage II sporulation protein P n=1 Tax=Bacillus sp. UNC438CL73TsuS30 TaxID=1340434 RepID=UPI00047D21DE|nr:stage II sporulation protein P [Bacillus sp. UNC438CL73TsuS30]